MKSVWRGTRLGPRLFVTLAAVCAVGAATAWVVAAWVGPGLFHRHLLEAGLGTHDQATMHAEEAYASASVLALVGAVAAAAVMSLAVSFWVARRLSASLESLTKAAVAVGRGDYQNEVRSEGLGPEFDALAGSFNAMALRLQQADALRERLLADLAHELRTPVANLDATLEAISDGVIDLDDSAIARLRDQGRRLTRLAEDLASVTRAQAGQLSLALVPIAADALIDRAVAAGSARASERGVRLGALPASGLPPVFVDPERIAQVLDNLIANALVHSDAGDAVTLSAAVSGAEVAVSVQDQGAGIPAEHLPHIFERFYRLDSARDRDSGGSGVGLAICRAIVEAHGGAMTAQSEGPGHGATFTFTMPTAPPGV